MSKRVLIICLVIAAILSIGYLIGGYFVFSTEDTNITDDYIMVFHGGDYNISYETYLYKKGFKYKYISTLKTNKDSKVDILNVGKVKDINEAISVAKDNGADNYITLNGDDKRYSFDEIRKIYK